LEEDKESDAGELELEGKGRDGVVVGMEEGEGDEDEEVKEAEEEGEAGTEEEEEEEEEGEVEEVGWEEGGPDLHPLELCPYFPQVLHVTFLLFLDGWEGALCPLSAGKMARDIQQATDPEEEQS
jgi:hypothetical protein